MESLGFDFVRKINVAAQAYRIFTKDSMVQAVVQSPAPLSFFRDRKVTAAALLLIGASMALDLDSEVGLKQFVVARMSRHERDNMHALVRRIVQMWVAHTES